MRARDAYWTVRRRDNGLKKEAVRFEGLAWVSGDGAASRVSGGHVLRARYVNGDPEATIIYPDGTSRRFA